MPEMLRQSCHRSTAPTPRAHGLARAVLLCGMSVSCAACPAVLDLDADEPDVSGEPEPVEADAGPPPRTSRENEPDAADQVPARVIGPSSPPPLTMAPCLASPPPPGVLRDGGLPDTGAESSLARGARDAETNPPGAAAALRAVVAAGFMLPCGAEDTPLQQLPDGYELSALKHTGLCPPFEILLYRLRVSKSGQVTVLDVVTVTPVQRQCDGGPSGLSQDLEAPPLA